ncbi:MAG: glycosyltransferase family 9 protein [Kiritimatiellae bacterium]|nr:glycosyltransferase family 9 protein [Kiritimatiellia bacterium]
MSAPRILIVKLSSLGDIMHALPTVHALREQLQAEIHWAVQPEYAALVGCFPDVARIVTVPRRRWWQGLGTAWRELRRVPFDMAIDLQGLCKSAIVTRAARARRRIGPSYAREGAWLFYTELAGKPNRERHAVEQAMDVLDLLGLQRPRKPEVALHYPTVALPGAVPRVAILPTSRWETKNWPVEHFATVARRLTEECGATLLVLGDAAATPTGETIRAQAPQAIVNACGRYSLPELFGVLSQCDLLIANDTGPVHMAAALGVPCLVLFGPTRPERTGPYGPNHHTLQRDLPCRPCMSRRCRIGGHACLAGLPCDLVFDTAAAMLANPERRP